MLEYRLYCLDEVGKLHFAELVIASDDADAVQQARLIKPSMRLCEVWQGSRLAATLEPQDLAG